MLWDKSKECLLHSLRVENIAEQFEEWAEQYLTLLRTICNKEAETIQNLLLQDFPALQ